MTLARTPEDDEIALADVRTLDDWATDGRYYQTDGDAELQLFSHCDSAPQCFTGPTPDAARHAAAEWVRGQKDREWDASAMTNSPRRKP